WYLKKIKIQMLAQQQQYSINKCLSSTQGDQRLFVELSQTNIRSSSPSTPSVYLVTIQTADVSQSKTTDNVEMIVRGSEGQIAKLLLKDYAQILDENIFQQGNSDAFEIEHEDIGNIESITIGFSDSEQQVAWLLEYVDIKYKETFYRFQAHCWLSSRLGPNFSWMTIKPDTTEDANRWLSKEKDDNKTYIDLTPDGRKTPPSSPVLPKNQATYTITVVTSSEADASTDSGVLMTIFGDKDQTTQFPLSNTKLGDKPLFESGKTNEFEMELDDVGDINKINIGIDGQGNQPSWHLKSIQIRKGSENYNFTAKKVLNQSKSSIDLTPDPAGKTPSPEPAKIETPRSHTPEQKAPPVKEISYKVLVCTGSDQKDSINEDAAFYIIIHGQKNQTKKLYLKEATISDKKDLFKKDGKTEFEFKTIDVGKIEKIVLGQDDSDSETIWHVDNVTIKRANEITPFNVEKTIERNSQVELTPSAIPKKTGNRDSNEQTLVWDIDNITIKRNNETTTFNVERQLEKDAEIELKPSPILKKTGTPRKASKRSDCVPKTAVKMTDANYEIIISTGDQALEASAAIKIHGNNGTVRIPLTETKSGDKPFQSKSTSEFTSETNDVGKIKRIIIEHDGTDTNVIWHLKSVQIKKESETYHFHADVHLDFKETKVNLYPIGALFGHTREDYVQTELRRLRESLRAESSKLRPPIHKVYEPFVYNDLGPYFDTSSVEKAIYSPLEAPPGYYTRLTALRIVEPWETYGMDYAVNYQIVKHRRVRSVSSSKQPKNIVQSGIMFIPPVALPYGNKIKRINTLEFDRAQHERARSSKPRSPSRHNTYHEQAHIIKMNP
ncbi:unnamed protein product, partial [Rotaria magnacalcarata]